MSKLSKTEFAVEVAVVNFRPRPHQEWKEIARYDDRETADRVLRMNRGRGIFRVRKVKREIEFDFAKAISEAACASYSLEGIAIMLGHPLPDKMQQGGAHAHHKFAKELRAWRGKVCGDRVLTYHKRRFNRGGSRWIVEKAEGVVRLDRYSFTSPVHRDNVAKVVAILERLHDGEVLPSVVFVVGPAGCGKSKLVNAIQEAAQFVPVQSTEIPNGEPKMSQCLGKATAEKVIVFENVKRIRAVSTLLMFMTCRSFSYRRHGSNVLDEVEPTAMIFIVGGPDLIIPDEFRDRRAFIISLESGSEVPQ